MGSWFKGIKVRTHMCHTSSFYVLIRFLFFCECCGDVLLCDLPWYTSICGEGHMACLAVDLISRLCCHRSVVGRLIADAVWCGAHMQAASLNDGLMPIAACVVFFSTVSTHAHRKQQFRTCNSIEFGVGAASAM